MLYADEKFFPCLSLPFPLLLHAHTTNIEAVNWGEPEQATRKRYNCVQIVLIMVRPSSMHHYDIIDKHTTIGAVLQQPV